MGCNLPGTPGYKLRRLITLASGSIHVLRLATGGYHTTSVYRRCDLDEEERFRMKLTRDHAQQGLLQPIHGRKDRTPRTHRVCPSCPTGFAWEGSGCCRWKIAHIPSASGMETSKSDWDLPSNKVVDELIALASGSVHVLRLATARHHTYHHYISEGKSKYWSDWDSPGTSSDKVVSSPFTDAGLVHVLGRAAAGGRVMRYEHRDGKQKTGLELTR